VEGLTRAILDWGDGALRPWPWRATRDRWGVLVSEVMLQQTQASRVAQKWVDFVATYPTPAACAAAPLGALLRRWEGLGYPRRCRYLHAAAREIVARHGGRVPGSLLALLALPGVGPYTARAVLAFADAAPVGIVDVNVARVLARLDGRPAGARALQARADALVPPDRAWEWNQALMELGARLCTARAPGCGQCPAARTCAWRGRGPDPARASAHRSRPQPRYEGSDRQARGRLLRALGRGPLAPPHLAGAAGLGRAHARARRLADALVAEGLARRSRGRYRLP
jgi:A/G-specific adenine glycosylase